MQGAFSIQLSPSVSSFIAQFEIFSHTERIARKNSVCPDSIKSVIETDMKQEFLFYKVFFYKNFSCIVSFVYKKVNCENIL